MKKIRAKPLPVFNSDEEAESFVANADLTQYDLSHRLSLSEFELRAKDASIHMRMPKGQLDQIKAEADRRGIPYQRFMRQLIENGMRALGRS
jgi:predicted DNA binding CopG/RHH family protein